MAMRNALIMLIFMLFCQCFLPGQTEPTGPTGQTGQTGTTGQTGPTGNQSMCHIFKIKKTGTKISIDGHITEEAWKDALVIDVNNEIGPGDNVPAPVKAYCLILYDDKNFYVAFKADDPEPGQIRAHQSDRDYIGNDDIFGIYIDTFNDQNRAFGFFCNPLGIQMDEIFSDGGSYEDIFWDAIWDSAGGLNEKGYEIEMAIPFKALQFPRGKDSQTWGIMPTRIYPRSQFHQITNSTHDRSNPCILCQFPKLEDIENVSPGRNIELDPTVTAFRTDARDVFLNGPMQKKNAEIDAGISARWGFTSNLTLSAAVNPDFSQVEADSVQLDINTQFTLQYPEKRPFFLEGKDFFATLIDAVYTRNLADPGWGIKVSGKEGKNVVGLFLSRDKITNLLLPGSESSNRTTLDQGSTSAVIRWRRDIGASSTVGVLFTSREGKDYYNRLAGIDGLLRIGNSDYIRFQALGSSTNYPDITAQKFSQKDLNMTGYALQLNYNREVRSYNLLLNYENFSPDFRADMGFIPHVNYWRALANAFYKIWGKENSFFSYIEAGCELYSEKEYGGQLLDRKIKIWTDVDMPLQIKFLISAFKQERVYKRNSFNLDSLYFRLLARPVGNFSLECHAFIGEDIDYVNARQGKYFYIEPGLTYRLGRHLSTFISYNYSYMDVDEGRLFHTHILQGTLLYHFNNRAFLRGIIQYKDFKQNVALYRVPIDIQDRHMLMQFLFSYKLNPRTVFFLGYSDNYQGLLAKPLQQSDRTFFIKIGYALSI